MTDQKMTEDLRPFLNDLAMGKKLSAREAELAFSVIMEGAATPTQIGAFLMALRLRGESPEELVGAVRAMRSKMKKIKAPDHAIDVCGTGGDGAGTLNVSTAVAFILAACGVPVAKHGNRAASSKSGAADVLSALGVNIEADFSLLEEALAKGGTAFLWAQRHHGAMRHVGPARTELGIRTIFNIMGPLSNPAGVKRQMIGVFSKDWLEPMAKTLGSLNTEIAWLVHGKDGLDELTITDESYVCEWKNGSIRSFSVSPEDAGLTREDPASIHGGTPEQNAAAILRLLAGEQSAYRSIVLLNSAAGLVVAGAEKNLKDGARRAAASIDSGGAMAGLRDLIEITNRPKIDEAAI